jgi:nitrate/nitrite transport system substrate-binding protein
VERRRFLRTSGLAALSTGAAVSLSSLLAGCGDDSDSSSGSSGRSGRDVTLGFIALTDFTALAIAEVNGYFADRDLNVEVRKETSWATTRDNLLSGEIDGAHCLFWMPFSVATGIGGGGERDMRVAMMLNQNGQGITLSNQHFAGVGYADLDGAAAAIGELESPTLAMTFPGGTHDLWLEYWLLALATGRDLRSDLDIQTIPPPEMVSNMRAGNMVGFCVGEPWNAVAVDQDLGFTHLATQDLWEHHSEKSLVVNRRFAEEREDVLRDVMGAIFEASRWLDEADASGDLLNRTEAAEIVAPQNYINAPADEIGSRLNGAYDLGGDLGNMTFAGNQMMFHRDGLVNFPRRGHAIWGMAQYQRFGYLDEAPPYQELADELILSDLYAEVAEAEGVDVPDDDMEPFEIKLDGAVFDPSDPDEEAARP